MKKMIRNLAAALLFCIAGTACAKDAPGHKADKNGGMPDIQGVIIVTEEVAYADGCENCPCTGPDSKKCVCPDKTRCPCCLMHMKKVADVHQQKCINAKKKDCAQKGIRCPRLIRKDIAPSDAPAVEQKSETPPAVQAAEQAK